jgi:hypothetical protein
VWLAIQAGALVLAAARVPFSARYPSPEETLAVPLMVIAQVTAGAMLFPVLMRTITSSIAVIGSTIPFIQLAAVLAAETDNRRLVWCGVYVAVWLAALAVLNGALVCARGKLYAVAAATVAALGGVMLAYLHREFGAPREALEWGRHAWLGPIMGCLAILEGDPGAGRIWIFLGASLGAAVGVLGITRWRGRKRGNREVSDGGDVAAAG